MDSFNKFVAYFIRVLISIKLSIIQINIALSTDYHQIFSVEFCNGFRYTISEIIQVLERLDF